jgi:restriction system protein
MSRYGRYNYGFGGSNYGFSLGKSLFKSGGYKHGKSKYSLENGCSMLIVGIIALAFLGGKTGQANSASLIQSLWPFIILIAIIIGLRLVYREYQHDKLAKTGIFDIDKMTGTEFEERLMILYRNLGYKVEHTGKTGDLGVDLIVEKNGEKTAIQAKRYHGSVNEAAVQEVYTGKTIHHCDRAIIFTNSNFTKFAQQVALKTNVQLCGRNDLIKLLEIERENLGQTTSQPNNRVKADWVDNAASWLARKVPLSKDGAIRDTQQNTNLPQTEPPHPQPNPQLVKYISKHIFLGEEWADLKKELMQNDWSEDELNDAFFQIYNPKPKETTEQAPPTEQPTKPNQN